jgi:hypothetical protein
VWSVLGRASRTLGACLALLCATVGLAGAQDHERARVIAPLPADLDERLVGQTSDLEWTLETTRASTPRDLDEATRLSRGARVVIWVEALPNGLRLHFVDVRERRLLVRDFGAPNDEPFGGSANVESVAVAVRSALQALSLGGEVGVAAPPPTPDPRVEPNEPATPIAPTDESPPVVVEVDAGWWTALDGESPIQHGPTLRLGLRRARLVLGLGGEVGLGARLTDALTRVTVTRHVAFFDFGAAMFVRPRGGLDLLARVGVARIARGEVEARVDGLSPEPATTTTSVLFGLRLVGHVALGEHLAVRLLVGADAIPSAPVLRYADDAGNTQIRNRFWWLQPGVALAIVVRSGASPAPAEANRQNLTRAVTRFSSPPSLWRRWR